MIFLPNWFLLYMNNILQIWLLQGRFIVIVYLKVTKVKNLKVGLLIG